MQLKQFLRDFRTERHVLSVLLSIILLRLVSFGHLAISDPTESRYAEIARQMYVSRDWVTPRLYVHGELIPYWGKPPLHFWLTSLSYRLFGVSEWSSRLPSILAGLLILVATFLFAKRIWSIRVALISAMILASSGLFFVLWGSSIIDMTLSALMTVSMIAFAMCFTGKKEWSGWLWGILFFVCLALSTLTKGLVAPFTAGFSIAIWWLTSIRRPSLRHVPWITGSLVFLAITAPWYLIQEQRTPGFLRYFFVNEHLLRFLTHDYGDKYGSGHIFPWGTIWGMLLATYLPWTIFFIVAARTRIKKRNLFAKPGPGEIGFRYVFIWAITPALFFTFSRQLLATYLLPGFAALAIGTAVAIVNWTTLLERNSQKKLLYIAALAIPVLIVAGTFSLGDVIDQQRSIKPLFTSLAGTVLSHNLPLIFPFFEPASADFYENLYRPMAIVHTKWPSVSVPDKTIDALIILRIKQWQNLDPGLRGHLALVEKRGEWAAFCSAAPGSLSGCNIRNNGVIK